MELNQEVQPLVTVIIPLYDAQDYIAETIESVINQAYQNWEMIIVDDCSTDNSRKIVKDYEIKDSRIKLIELETNFGGPARPRNVGIDNAKGEFVAFLDADDVWLPNKLEKQLDFMKENNVNFTSCYCSLINASSNVVFLSKKSSFYYKLVSKKSVCDVIKNSFIITSSVLIKKDLLSRFSEEKNFIAVEDFDMWLRTLVLDTTKYKYQDEKLIKYRLLEESVSDRNNLLGQELKANIVLSNFIYKNPDYVGCYLKRQFMQLCRKTIKNTLCNSF